MQTYEERDKWKASGKECFQYFWANMANVEIQWDFNRDIEKYRLETFCYGPKSYKYYKMCWPHSVPYINSGSALYNGYLDELCTEGRDYND